MWLKEKMENMSQGTEQLLFCIYCVVFTIIFLFTEFLPDFSYAIILIITGLWLNRLAKLARENKS